MFVLECLFWFCCFIVFYNYAGYAILAYIINRIKKRKTTYRDDYFPTVSFIVAAYNEEDCIEKKIINSLDQDYPKDKIEFIFITDGSTDKTADIISHYTSIRLLHQEQRSGKSAALNRAVAAAKNEVVIFSDANTVLNKAATKLIARHYQDAEVGGVAGEKKVLSLNYSDDQANSEGLYWKYESFLKKIDSDFHSVVGAAGELFSVRTSLFEALPSKVVLDDFVVSMKIAEKGYRIVYEPKAFASELPSFSIQDEHKRKVRIAAGGFQAIAMLPNALKFWNHFKLSYLYISHRVLRWAASPFCLVLAFIANLLLALGGAPFYIFTFVLQLGVYLSALMVQTVPNLGKSIKLLKLPYYFVFMNISVIQGFFRFLRRKQPSTWEKAKRSQSGVLEPTN